MQPKDILADGYNQSAALYDATAGLDYLRALHMLLPKVSIGPSPAILDAGCGTAINLTEAARILGPCERLVGVDLSPGMLAIARRKAALMGLEASFLVGDVEELTLSDESFDLVICNGVYHWFEDRYRALAGFARTLRPGGQLLIVTLAAPAFHEWAGVIEEAWAEVAGDERAWFPVMPTAVEVKANIENAGLVMEHFRYDDRFVTIQDVPRFLSNMRVIAPNWTGGTPGRCAAIVAAVERAIARRYPSGFACTWAGIDLVARKPGRAEG